MTWTKDTDNVTCLVNMLTSEWDTSKHTPAPSIRSVSLPLGNTGINWNCASMGEVIFVREVSYREEVRCLGATGYGFEGRYSFDLRCMTRSRLDSMYKELRRVLWENKNSPVDSSGNAPEFNEISLNSSRIDLSDKKIGISRYIYDVYLRNRSKVVTTT